ncbi:MAG: hypothetical protein ACE5ED_01195 [Rhodothalassiaceae bacterium]
MKFKILCPVLFIAILNGCQGDRPLEKLKLTADIKYDKFVKSYDVSTPFYDNMLIRGSVDAKSNRIIYVQLYTDLVFFEEWGYIETSIDTDGNRHEVTQISSDVDCYSEFLGCELTEGIGITLSKDFLESHRNGFEIKAYGAQEKIITVPRQLIESFLLGLDKAIQQSKNKPGGVQPCNSADGEKVGEPRLCGQNG